jgi:GDP-L-fucose synthase
MFDNVLVTGGSGFLGSRLKIVSPEWNYVSSRDYDLTDSKSCHKMYEDIKPDAVIHLAGKVGGIKENTTKQADFYYQNTMINTNVLHEAYKSGVKRVLSALSTCTFPDVVANYPFTENDILAGPPASSNLAYGFAKRGLFIQSNSYRSQYGLNYSTFTPSNLYGPYDNFDLESSHFVAAMIRKFYEARNGDVIEFWGSGRALRQQLFVGDLARVVPELLEKHNSNVPIIVAPSENLSIKEMIKVCKDVTGKDVQIKFDGRLDGQYRKDGDNKRLVDLLGSFEFTSFRDGLRKTWEDYSAER